MPIDEQLMLLNLKHDMQIVRFEPDDIDARDVGLPKSVAAWMARYKLPDKYLKTAIQDYESLSSVDLKRDIRKVADLWWDKSFNGPTFVHDPRRRRPTAVPRSVLNDPEDKETYYTIVCALLCHSLATVRPEDWEHMHE